MLTALSRMMVHGRVATAALGRHSLLAFPHWRPSLRTVAKAASSPAFIPEVQYDDRVQKLVGPPKVQLRGRLETEFVEKTSPDGTDRFAEAQMVVSYKKGQRWNEDRYVLDVDGPVYDTFQPHLVRGSWVAVEGELFLERLPQENGGEDQIAVVAVNAIKHSHEWTPAFARAQREARSSASPQPDPGMSAANVTAMAQQQQQASPPPQQQRGTPPRSGAGVRKPQIVQPAAAQQAQQPQQPQQVQQVQVQTPAQQQQLGGVRGYGAADYGGFGKQPAAPASAASAPSDAADLAWLADASTEDKWKHVDANLNMWWDNRTNKKNPKAPDFKLKVPKTSTLNVALWISSKDTPDWVKQKFAVDAA